MADKKFNILVTNDDGYRAPGIRALVEVVKEFGNVTVVAPDDSRSGMSNAITVYSPLRVKKIKEEENLTVYKCNGTPVDCVKIGISELMDETPDLLVSGINHGANSSVSVLYSGTMGAAIEGTIHGIDSIGFSLCDYSKSANFEHTKSYIRDIVSNVLEEGLSQNISLNVNFPVGDIKGVTVCRQSRGKWMEEFEKRQDPAKRSYYWLTGYYQDFEPEAKDTDSYALENGMVAITPITIDMTAYKEMERIKNWNISLNGTNK
ncbi:5'/3'-nucleotidase SurE [Prolixibacteraceae bacterium JC049]|nr:5'/3'-nucleotidase SurE [Prolixibacteraceae bacterium JC049]